MNTPESQEVVRCFFEALYRLKADRRIRGKQTFTPRKNVSRDIFQPAWLSFLVRDYGVSADWLLTGRGDFYRRD